MTCFIATADPILANELKVLSEMACYTVTNGTAELLLLDMDTSVDAPACAKIIRFSRRSDVGADFVRPFSYDRLLSEMKVSRTDVPTEQASVGYTMPAAEKFTATEKRLLDALLEADGEAVSAQDLAQTVFGNAECHNELKVYIRHLRQKLEEPQGVRIIETVRGMGYRMRKDRIVHTKVNVGNGGV